MSDRPRNAFLTSLGDDTYAALQPHLKRVDLVLASSIIEPGDTVQVVYFPEGALISLLSNTSDGERVETQMSGNEGASHLLEACGSGQSAVSSLVQVDGGAWTAPVRVIRDLMLRDEAFASRAWSLIEMQMIESRQSGMCQALHGVEYRFARWLLESAERCGGRTLLPLTQEFMAAMLGVQRTTVTGFAAQLQKKGLIRYSRGRLELLDPKALELKACECRAVMRDHRRRLHFEAMPIDGALSGLNVVRMSAPRIGGG